MLLDDMALHLVRIILVDHYNKVAFFQMYLQRYYQQRVCADQN